MNTRILLTLAACTLIATALPSMADTTPAFTADPAAHDLLKAAHDSRATFAGSFSSITADVAFDDNGQVHSGAATYSPKDDAALTVAGLTRDQNDWLSDQVDSIFAHRRGGDFDKGEGRDPITFGPDDHSPLGRLVEMHDRLQSRYRIRDNQVVEVTRTMGGQRFTITVLETTRTDDGKYLPREFLVTYFDDKTGAIQRSQAFTDTYAQIDSLWLPTSRRVITAADGKFTTRTITLTNITVRK